MPEGRRPRPTSKQQPSIEPAPGFIAVGLIHAARGIRGELRVEPLSNVEGRFDAGATVYVEGVTRKVIRSRRDRHGLLLTLDGIVTRDEAEAVKGRLLEVREANSPALQEDTYYRHQLIGLRVRDVGGNDLGRIEEVLETGANDVLVVRNESGETLIPAVDSMVREVDLNSGQVLVELMAGLEQRPLTPFRRKKRTQAPAQHDR